MSVRVIAILIGIILGYFILSYFVNKFKFAVRNTILAIFFFVLAGVCTLLPNSSLSRGWNSCIVWTDFAIGIWYLSRAFFFFDNKELKKETN